VRIYVRFGYLPVEESLALAPLVEELGYDGVSLPDHLFFPDSEPGAYPYSRDGRPPFRLESPWPDVFVLASALAARTTTIRFLTSVYVLPLRDPLVVAKAAGTAAVASGGRFALGIGAGWQREEFDALGVPFEERGARTDEAIRVLRTLWQPGPVEYRGRFTSFGPIHMEPRPAEPVPILVGGSSEAAIRRAVALGDGYCAPDPPPQGDLVGLVRRVRQRVAESGRDAADFTVYASTPGIDADGICALAGDIDAIGVLPWPSPGKETTPLDEKRRLLERFAADVLAPSRERLGAPA
jgi:probable F420-dependent oxidoreductase